MLPEAEISLARALLDGEALELADLLHAASDRSHPSRSLREVLVDERYVTLAEVEEAERRLSDSTFDSRFHTRRYELGGLLGKGANGFVLGARDQHLGRDVALKFHSKEAQLSSIELGRFAHEAQVTGQLSHPSIVPVHDLGVLPDGRPYYSMKKIAGSTLKQIFDRLKLADSAAVKEWTLPHFIRVMLRVAQACAFAHDHGVVHRDVKPANIMAGPYGEVLLLDWGVARVLGDEECPLDPVRTWRSEDDQDRTIVGTVAGTPAYMPPEQAKGQIDLIGPASDVYSIGVVIYEFVVGRRPFRAKSVRELLDKVAEETIVPPSKRSDRRLQVIPPDLELIIMRCLEKSVASRYPSGLALANALEEFLEGSRRRDEAERLTKLGDLRAAEYRQAGDQARQREQELLERRVATPPWADANLRQQVWADQARWQKLRGTRDNIYDEAISLYQSALKAEPENLEARDGLAGLFVRRMEEAERRGELATARFFKGQALRYDTGRFRPHIQGPFRVSLNSDRAQTQVRVQPVRLERDRVLRAGESSQVGDAPLTGMPLEPGSWLITVSASGTPDIRVPVYSHKPRRIELSVRFDLAAQVHEGYVFIAGGAAGIGGDPRALEAGPLEELELPAFAIGRHPITQAEFRAFLEATKAEDSFRCWGGPVSVPAEERLRLPALGVPRHGAEAYAEWLSQRTSLRFRLPTSNEWEKAARGADRRIFPWGNDWEASYCNGPDGVAGDACPRAVGSCPQDCSIYGVYDLAGGVAEWVSDPVPHRPDRGWVRGGSWNSRPQHARLASRQSFPISSAGGTLGFRLVQVLSG